MKFRARQFEFSFPSPVLMMGIVNVTPDSFSDGGRFADVASAVAHAAGLVSQGAAIIDIGGESTRPGAVPVSEAEELRRVLPVLEELAARIRVPISIDTMKPGVARAALEAGASMVNDVGANRVDPAMWELVAETGAGYVCMHMQGTPQTMQTQPAYLDVAQTVSRFFESKLRELSICGVESEQIILDPGIGFGKTFEHNLGLLGALTDLGRLQRPLMLGVSRKSFLGQLSGASPAERLPEALACSCLAVEAGVQVVRTHDVAETLRAVRMAELVLSKRKR